MKLIEAKDVPENKLKQFKEAHNFAAHCLSSGYVVEQNEKIIGCFELIPIEEQGAYWLKQLYIIREEAMQLPVMLEYILHFAKEKNSKIIYAHSAQPVTDLLLQSLRFSYREPNIVDTPSFKEKKVTWWAYQYADEPLSYERVK